MYSSSLINARIMNDSINLTSLNPASLRLFMPFVKDLADEKKERVATS